MGKRHSEFDRVKAHLRLRGPRTPVTGRALDDLETLVRRYDEVRSLGQEYGEVELSPFMHSLLRVSRAPEVSLAAEPAAAAGV